jgi:START domain
VYALVLLATLATDPSPAQAAALENKAPWAELNTADGITLYRREIKDNFYWEYRATAVTDVSLDALCTHVFEWGSKSKDHQGMKLRRLVRDGDDERVTYDNIDEPIVASRDFAMTIKRVRDPNGTCRIPFYGNAAEAPPTPRGFVRIEKLWGGWTFSPRADGKVDVSYVMFADPAGSIPPFLVHGTQAERTRQSVKKAIALARAGEQKSKVAATAPAGQ